MILTSLDISRSGDWPSPGDWRLTLSPLPAVSLPRSQLHDVAQQGDNNYSTRYCDSLLSLVSTQEYPDISKLYGIRPPIILIIDSFREWKPPILMP